MAFNSFFKKLLNYSISNSCTSSFDLLEVNLKPWLCIELQFFDQIRQYFSRIAKESTDHFQARADLLK